ncbi:MAG: HDOD domain-containing protein [Holophaga sp.]|nr:HDOD domain-containing protein [Holophaga sp.]
MITSDLVRQRVKTLPSLPTTVLALGQAVGDDRCTVDRILGILAQDPALSATLLRLANSVMYVRDDRVMDLRSAVMRLGFDSIFNLGQSAAIIRSIRGGSHLDPRLLWQHSVAVGLVAKGICGLLGQTQHLEPAYLAGLLHDIGKIALDQCFSEEYGPVVEAMAAGAVCLDAERALLGVTHAEVGAMVAVQWNFPEPMVAAIRDHHEPGGYLASLIQLSDLLVRTRIPNSPADEQLAFVLGEEPAFKTVFAGAAGADLDEERLTFGIDDELEHAITFVKLVFQE